MPTFSVIVLFLIAPILKDLIACHDSKTYLVVRYNTDMWHMWFSGVVNPWMLTNSYGVQEENKFCISSQQKREPPIPILYSCYKHYHHLLKRKIQEELY